MTPTRAMSARLAKLVVSLAPTGHLTTHVTVRPFAGAAGASTGGATDAYGRGNFHMVMRNASV